MRSVWLALRSTQNELEKLSAALDVGSEQTAKNVPTVNTMLDHIRAKAPLAAHKALVDFSQHNWQALNSYAHAGIHPLRRHADGYPTELLTNVLCNASGLG